MREIQGKCPTCKIAFRFHPRREVSRLKDAYCPRCGTKLQATTHLIKWPWIENEWPVSFKAAYFMQPLPR